MLSLLKKWFGVGYVPCNEEADALAQRAANLPAGALISAPWSKQANMTADGRMGALAAIRTGNFGVAKRVSGLGTSEYRFYYGRELTGNWFAEVWPLWKVLLIASPLTALIFGPHGTNPWEVILGNDPSDPQRAFVAFIVGLLLVLFFLGRGIVSIGCQAMVNAAAGFEFSGPAGLLSLSLGVLGLNLAFVALFHEWAFPTYLLEGTRWWIETVYLYPDFATLKDLVVLVFMFVPAMFLGASFFWFCTFKWLGSYNTAQIASDVAGAQNFQTFQSLYVGSFVQTTRTSMPGAVIPGLLLYGVVFFGVLNLPIIYWFFLNVLAR